MENFGHSINFPPAANDTCLVWMFCIKRPSAKKQNKNIKIIANEKSFSMWIALSFLLVTDFL